jgi:amino acid transporter
MHFRRIALGLLLIAGLAYAGMSATSYFRYSTAGFDHDERVGDRVHTTYYRVRFSHGSFWLGAAKQDHADDGKSVDFFDIGGTPFARLNPLQPQSLLQHLGFWAIKSVETDPFEPHRYVGAVWSYWLAIPVWLPLVFLGVWWRYGRRRKPAVSG